MTDLSKEIEELVSLRNEYETKRRGLNNKVRELFNPEFEKIKSNMPKGYEIDSFDVDDGGVCMPNPCFKERIAGFRDIDTLNEIFKEEFLRIREKYGFVVRFDQVSYIG